MFYSAVAILEFIREAICNLLLKTIYIEMQSPRYTRLDGIIPKSIVSQIFPPIFLTIAWFYKTTDWVLFFSEASCPARYLTVSE